MTATSTLAFRKAVPEDARALAAFQVRALEEDCREFLPQHALDDVARGWRRLRVGPRRTPVADLSGTDRADLARRPATLAAPRATVPAGR